MAGAKAWWRGEDPPICFANLKTDDCGFVEAE